MRKKRKLDELNYADTSFPMLLSGERRYYICKKCGKYNGSIFLEYEGMGFK